jgi:hypothetical protein
MWNECSRPGPAQRGGRRSWTEEAIRPSPDRAITSGLGCEEEVCGPNQWDGMALGAGVELLEFNRSRDVWAAALQCMCIRGMRLGGRLGTSPHPCIRWAPEQSSGRAEI